MSKKRGKDDAGGETPGAFSFRAFLDHLTGFCIVLLFLGLLVGVTLGIRPLERRAAAEIATRPPEVEIRWPAIKSETGSGETWVDRASRESLEAAVRDAIGKTPDPTRGDVLARIGRRMEASGWFAGAPTVRREAGWKIVVEGDWRIPAAVVRHGERDYLISWDARPMPPQYPVGATRLRAITGSALGPPRDAAGGRDFTGYWAGEDVVASLELLRLIATQPWAGQVAAVDAAEYTDNGRLTLVTTKNTRILWGGRPRKPLPGEAGTATKLERLAHMHREFNSIDANADHLDIRILQSPPTIQRSATTVPGAGPQ